MAKANKQPQLSAKKYIQTKASSLPIHECMISSGWKENGIANIIICRRHKSGNFTVGLYLVDLLCLGVKDAFYYFNINEIEYDEIKDSLSSINSEPTTYELVHNIIYGATEYAEELGISPHPDFAIAKYILEENTDDIPLIEINFGLNDEPHLFVKNKQELNKYLPILKQTVPDIKFYVADDDYRHVVDFDEHEYLDEEEESFFDSVDQSPGAVVKVGLLNMIKLAEESLMLTHSIDQKTQDKQLNSAILRLKELIDLENDEGLDTDIILNTLQSCRQELIYAFENIIRYAIDHADEYLEYNDSTSMLSGNTLVYAVIYLAEFESKGSFNLILQILRHDNEFLDYHFDPAVDDVIAPALFKTGDDQLTVLFDFVTEPGLKVRNKSAVLDAVSAVGIKYPQRRGEVIQWFRDLINFLLDHIDNDLIYDAELSGMIMCELINLKAKELLPEIKKMFAANQVDFSCAGDYNEVSTEILSFGLPETSVEDYTIYKMYKACEY